MWIVGILKTIIGDWRNGRAEIVMNNKNHFGIRGVFGYVSYFFLTSSAPFKWSKFVGSQKPPPTPSTSVIMPQWE
jgi:hypothetical protein